MNEPDHINVKPTDRILFVRIEKTFNCKDPKSADYRPSLYEATRKYWVLSPKKLDKIDLLVGYAGGVVREVIRPLKWRITDNPAYAGRYECEGEEIADSEYLGKCVLNIITPSRNSRKYVNID